MGPPWLCGVPRARGQDPSQRPRGARSPLRGQLPGRGAGLSRHGRTCRRSRARRPIRELAAVQCDTSRGEVGGRGLRRVPVGSPHAWCASTPAVRGWAVPVGSFGALLAGSPPPCGNFTRLAAHLAAAASARSPPSSRSPPAPKSPVPLSGARTCADYTSRVVTAPEACARACIVQRTGS